MGNMLGGNNVIRRKRGERASRNELKDEAEESLATRVTEHDID